MACPRPLGRRALRAASLARVPRLPTVRRGETGALARQVRTERELAPGCAEGVPAARAGRAPGPRLEARAPATWEMETKEGVGPRCAEPVDETSAVRVRDTVLRVAPARAADATPHRHGPEAAPYALSAEGRKVGRRAIERAARQMEARAPSAAVIQVRR